MTAQTTGLITLTIDGREFPIEFKEGIGIGLTPREWGVMKRIAGISGAIELGQALRVLDVQCVAALALVALTRAGQPTDEDAMLDGRYVLALRFEETPSDPPGVLAGADPPASPSSPTTPIPAPTGSPA